MYHIAICDDEQDFVTGLKEQVCALTAELGIPCRVTCYNGPAKLCDALFSPGCGINLLLLDILMGDGDDGMRLAARLREAGSRVSIVLVSSSPDFILRGYDVRALKYLLKPVKTEELRSVLLYDYRNHYKKQFLTLEIGSSMRGLPLGEVDCFEIKGKKIAAYLQSGSIEYRGKITELEALLPAEFFRCHQSFIVNLDNVVQLERYIARMKDGREVPVSQRLYQDTRQAYFRNLRSRLTVFEGFG